MVGKLLSKASTIVTLACALLVVACGQTIDTFIRPEPTAQPPRASNKIALLLPSGDETKRDLLDIAESLENAARLGVSDSDNIGIQLEVYPTRGTPEGATAAARLAINDGASIILGPVFADSSKRVAEIAAPSAVPVLSFSTDTSIVGDNLFILGQTFANSANRIVEFAAANGRQRVLAIYAENRQGRAGKLAIEQATIAYGSQFLELSYPFRQRDVIDAIPKITELVRAEEPDVIVFTANTAGALPLLGQLLFEQQSIDWEQVKFTGLTRWDIPNSNLSNQGLQGGWFILPDQNLLSSFESRYRYVYDEPPHSIAFNAYDGIVAATAALSAGNGRVDVAALTNPKGFFGAIGPFRLMPDGQNERALAIAEIRDGRVNIISEAPRNFSDFGS